MFATQSKDHASDFLDALCDDCELESEGKTPRRVFYDAFLAEDAEHLVDSHTGTCVFSQYGWVDAGAYRFAIGFSAQIIVPVVQPGEFILRICPYGLGMDFSCITESMFSGAEFIWYHRAYINPDLKKFAKKFQSS